MFFKKVVIHLREGGIITGLLLGIETDAIIARTGGQDVKFNMSNLLSISIETEEKTGRNLLYGILLGTYLGNQIFNRAKNQPVAYMKDIDIGWRFFLQNVIFAAAGGALGYLAGSGGEGEKTFDFNGSDKNRQAEWERFQKYVTGERSPRRVHFSIQAGHVFTNVAQRYSDLLRNAGFWVERRQDYESEPAGDFNLLRKIQLTISLKPDAEVGMALISVGEPSLYGENWAISSQVKESLHTVGCYVIGIYKPFLAKMPRKIVWNVGAGLGAAKVNFRLEHIFYSGYPEYTQVITPHHISKIYLSAVAFTELNFYIYDLLSLGFIADYVFVPSENAPEIRELGIPSEKLRLGNRSVGFSFGLHF
jgi:hypothetical protein